MSTSIVNKLIEKVAKLEAKVESLFLYQKWQMALLSLILGTIIAEAFLNKLKH
jgi:hypothetical protein